VSLRCFACGLDGVTIANAGTPREIQECGICGFYWQATHRSTATANNSGRSTVGKARRLPRALTLTGRDSPFAKLLYLR